ncbi:reverse transcriptase domain-containing protein [Tanacetum coccineum]
MAEGDEYKTTFFVGEGVFCYGKMPFSLKNAGATYQRLVDKVFSKQIGRNLEAYVDDMVIKSTSEEGMLSDIQETFERFRLINMRLDPKNKKALKILSSSHDNGSHRDERETPADFLPEIPFDDSEKKVKEKELSYPSKEWKLYNNKSSSPDGAGAGLMLIDLAGKEYSYALRFEFEITKNEAEYEALLAGLRISQEMETTKVAIFLDSQLVVNQIKGTYAAKPFSIKSYLHEPVNIGELDPDDSAMPELEIFHKSETGIFNEASYDEEGVVTDFNSLPTIIEVSPTPTLRIHNIHPKSQILGDPKSAVQTRSKVQQKSGAHALISYIQKQQRNNHKDQHHCLFACFLSQEEPKKISDALQDDSWVQVMQEELLQFKLQQV